MFLRVDRRDLISRVCRYRSEWKLAAVHTVDCERLCNRRYFLPLQRMIQERETPLTPSGCWASYQSYYVIAKWAREWKEENNWDVSNVIQ